MIERGIHKGSENIARRWIIKLIKNKDYCGQGKNVYPALIDEEIIDKCREMSKENCTKPKKVYTNYYFGKEILRCPKCGGLLAVKKNRMAYACVQCDKVNISVNAIDSALWYASFGIYIANTLNANANDRIAIQKQIMDIDTKISVANKSIKDIE
jgi:hypothetical protein